MTVSIPLGEIGLGGAAHYRLTNLWDGQTWMVERAALNDLSMTIAPDKTPGGGLKLILIERA